MSYLLIDLDKSVMKLTDVSPEAGAVLLFTKRKRKLAKKFAKQHRATKVVKCRKKDKIATLMIATLKKLLKADKTAGVVIISARKKVARAIDRLLDKYPNAELVLIDKVDKNQENHQVNENCEPKYLEKPPVVPLLAAPETNQASPTETDASTESSEPSVSPNTENAPHVPDMTKLLQDAVLLIQKNRPKKKGALLQELTSALRITPEYATEVLLALKENQHIQIDVTENVKYLVS